VVHKIGGDNHPPFWGTEGTEPAPLCDKTIDILVRGGGKVGGAQARPPRFKNDERSKKRAGVGPEIKPRLFRGQPLFPQMKGRPE